MRTEREEPDAGGWHYRIYYLNSTRTKLASVEYKTETTDQETLIGELAGQILAAPDNPDYPGGSGREGHTSGYQERGERSLPEF